MICHRIRIVLLALATAVVLVSCAATQPALQADVAPVTDGSKATDLKAIYAALPAVGGKVFTLNPQTSTVRIYAFRGGRAAKFGHNHLLSAPQFTGFFYLASSGTSGPRFDLEFRLDQLEFDKPEYRLPLGKAFPSVLTPEDIKGAHDHMLGAENLQADRFPFVRIHSLQIAGEAPKFAAKVEVELHGQKREMWMPLTVDGLPDRLSVTGAFVLRQTDFGAQPYTVLGGLLTMQD